MTSLILFDCDGTIVDSQHLIVASMAAAFEGAGLAVPPRQTILSIVGLSLVPAVRRLLPPGGDPEIAEHMAESYKAAFRELRSDPKNHEPLYPGARAAIETLANRAGTRLGVATGKSRRGVDALFEREGLGDYFATIQTADDHPSKPHPSMVHRALAETGAMAADTVMLGDTTYDMDMASAAGVVPVGVAWGYHDVAALMASGAAVIAHGYGEVPALIDQQLERSRGRAFRATGT